MLGGTAASLESCGLQRILPKATKSLRSSRQLHTTFWQHGAVDIELSRAWIALMHGTLSSDGDASSEHDSISTLNASAFLLDFLYPTGAMALLRRLALSSSRRLDRSRHRQSLSSLSPRLFASSLPSPPLPGHHESSKPGYASITSEQQQTHTRLEDVEENALTSVVSHEDALSELLLSHDPGDANQVWHHYKALNIMAQRTFLKRVLVFLNKAGRQSDSRKISELFHEIHPYRWDEDTFLAGMTAELHLDNQSEALEIFSRGLRHRALDIACKVEALDILLANALKYPTAAFLLGIWKYHSDMVALWDFDTIVAHLRRVTQVPDLAKKALRLQKEIEERIDDPVTLQVDSGAFDDLQTILVRAALASCSDDQVVPLLNLTKSHAAFEHFVLSANAQGRRRSRLITEVYQVYRGIPQSKPSETVLYKVFEAYTSLNALKSIKLAGIEQLWGDWYTFRTEPSRRAYQKFLGFYATQGYKEQVYKLWTEYVERFRHQSRVSIFEGDDTFAHLLQVHAVEGATEEVERIFNDITVKFGLTPNAHCWNILLNAYAKAGDYDHAIDIFDKINSLGKADRYSYGTLMQMAGSRGDLGFAVELYRQARKAQILANDAMLSSLVDAYCMNEQFKEAEDVCIRAVKKGVVATRMWNKLLHRYALRRDLASMNRVLNLMVDENVPYNHLTYKQLLLGLSVCRQSQHALHLLTVALEDRLFYVTEEHFGVVMGALIRTGEAMPVRRLGKLMTEFGFEKSSATLFQMARALWKWQQTPRMQRRSQKAVDVFGPVLRSFRHIYGVRKTETCEVDTKETSSGTRQGTVIKSSSAQYQFSSMIWIFTQLRDTVRSRELIDLYRYIFQDRQDVEGVLPARMISSIMLTELYDKHYDKVKDWWQLLYSRAKIEARSKDYSDQLPHASQISPKYRYILSGSLGTMMQVLFKEGDAAGAQALVRDVLAEGFQLDSKNWNYYVQVLVQLKQYTEAFAVCERELMPNWTGWYRARVREPMKNKLPLDVRRKGSAPRHLRPNAGTLYCLANGYIELDRMGPWSTEASQMAQEIDKNSVRTVRAIKSMKTGGSNLFSQIVKQSGDNTEDLELDAYDEEAASDTDGEEESGSYL